MNARTSFQVFLLAALLPQPVLLPQPIQDSDRDLSKRFVELPLETARSSPAPVVREKVAPGIVRWHADFEAACAAAELSRKPVLLFQLLGRLDEEFC